MKQYNGLSDVQDRLLQQKIIDLVGDVDQDMFWYVREAIIRLMAGDTPPIEIHISSQGGGCKSGFHIYDLIKNYPGRTQGMVIGFAHSAGSLILQACDNRMATANAVVHIHNPFNEDLARNEQEYNRLRKVREKALEIYRMKKINILLERTGRTRKQIEKAMYQAKIMTAEEALKFGLIDEIIQPKKLHQEQERTT